MLLALFLQSDLSQEQIQKLVIAMMALIPMFMVIAIPIFIIPAWFICKKAGFSPWLSLLCLIPSLGALGSSSCSCRRSLAFAMSDSFMGSHARRYVSLQSRRPIHERMPIVMPPFKTFGIVA